MPIFTPLYSSGRAIRGAREQQLNPRKRRRTSDSSSHDSSSGHEDNVPTSRSAPASTSTSSRRTERRTTAEPRTSTLYPVNKKDPYYIAGHAREEPLPPPPFPHKAAKSLSKPTRLPVEQSLAELKPPLYILPNTNTGSLINLDAEAAADPYPAQAIPTSDRQQHKTSSLVRRHADNLTTILHISLQRGDWARAERAWKLLLRTTVSGFGIDVRREGLWGIGGEILMRRAGSNTKMNIPSDGGDEDDDDINDLEDDGDDDDDADENEDLNQNLSLTDEGFNATKSFYERLILQHPYTSHSQHRFNATAVYPAFFSVWLYQICHASKVARRELKQRRRRRHRRRQRGEGQQDSGQSLHVVSMDEFYEGAALWAGMDEDEEKAIIQRELDGAAEVAGRIDELTQTPPYDSDSDLMVLRAMIQLWMADLTESLGRRPSSRRANDDRIEEDEEREEEGDFEDDDDDDRGFDLEKEVERQRYREDAAESRRRAHEMIGKLAEMGVKLPEGMQEARKKTWTSVVV